MIRVMIERHLKKTKKADLIPLLIKIRAAALPQPGYVTGETMVSTTDPSVVTVLSTWRSLDDWKAWEKSAERAKLYQQIEVLLQEKARVSVYQIMAAEEEAH